MGAAALAECLVLPQERISKRFFADTHHGCLGSDGPLPYSASRGKKSMNHQALDALKQQIPHFWSQTRF
jgi:hypothetical protein